MCKSDFLKKKAERTKDQSCCANFKMKLTIQLNMPNVNDIKIGDTKNSSASEMTEAFNCHFENIQLELAREIPPADTVPESFLISKNITFLF